MMAYQYNHQIDITGSDDVFVRAQAWYSWLLGDCMVYRHSYLCVVSNGSGGYL